MLQITAQSRTQVKLVPFVGTSYFIIGRGIFELAEVLFDAGFADTVLGTTEAGGWMSAGVTFPPLPTPVVGSSFPTGRKIVSFRMPHSFIAMGVDIPIGATHMECFLR